MLSALSLRSLRHLRRVFALPRSDDLRAYFQAQVITVGLASAGTACVLFGILLTPWSTALGALNGAGALGCIGLFVLQRRATRPELVIRTGCSMLFLLIVGQSYYLGGHLSPALAFLAPLSSAAVLLLGRFDAWFWIIAGVAAVAAYYFAGVAAMVPPAVLPENVAFAYTALYFSSALAMNGVFVSVWSARQRRLEGQVQDSLAQSDADARFARLEAHAASIAGDGLPFSESAARYLELVVDALGWEAAHLWTVDEFGSIESAPLWNETTAGALSDARDATRSQEDPGRRWLVSQVAGERKPTFSRDLDDEHRTRIAAEAAGFDVLAWPVDVGGAIGMVIECFAHRTTELDARAHKLLQQIAAQLGRVREREIASDRIHDIAFRDPVTTLANRHAFETALERKLEACTRDGRKLALMFIDLDGFKRVNDSLGHAAGDRLLHTVAQRLAFVVYGDAEPATEDHAHLVARLGGDEFTIVLDDTGFFPSVENLANRLCTAIEAPIDLGLREIKVGGSIGIAQFPADADNPSDLMRLADAAMYAAKSAVSERYCFATADLTRSIERRVWIETLLPEALDGGQFELLYQPIISTHTGRVYGHEGLLRWRRTEGEIAPLEFIPVAETCGLVHRITEWTVQEACQRVAANRRERGTGGTVSINVTAIQLQQPGLVAVVENAMREHGCAPGSLEFEIAETHPFLEQAACAEIMQQLHDAGVRIVLDRFGTGYGSLNNLRRLPVWRVKIEREFIETIEFEENERTISRSVIAMAHALGIEVTVCGVENEQQAGHLTNMGCDALQGLWVGPPYHEPRFDVARKILPEASAVLAS